MVMLEDNCFQRVLHVVEVVVMTSNADAICQRIYYMLLARSHIPIASQKRFVHGLKEETENDSQFVSFHQDQGNAFDRYITIQIDGDWTDLVLVGNHKEPMFGALQNTEPCSVACAIYMIRAEGALSPSDHPTLENIRPLYDGLEGLAGLAVALDNVSRKGIEGSIERCE
jgi:hypothetical protein